MPRTTGNPRRHGSRAEVSQGHPARRKQEPPQNPTVCGKFGDRWFFTNRWESGNEVWRRRGGAGERSYQQQFRGTKNRSSDRNKNGNRMQSCRQNTRSGIAGAEHILRTVTNRTEAHLLDRCFRRRTTTHPAVATVLTSTRMAFFRTGSLLGERRLDGGFFKNLPERGRGQRRLWNHSKRQHRRKVKQPLCQQNQQNHSLNQNAVPLYHYS